MADGEGEVSRFKGDDVRDCLPKYGTLAASSCLIHVARQPQPQLRLSLFLYTSACSAVYTLRFESDRGTYRHSSVTRADVEANQVAQHHRHSNCLSTKSRLSNVRCPQHLVDPISKSLSIRGVFMRSTWTDPQRLRIEGTAFEAAQPRPAKCAPTVSLSRRGSFSKSCAWLQDPVACRSLRRQALGPTGKRH
jgi:hypothetical protein